MFLTAGPDRCDALILDGTQPDTVRTLRLDRLTAHDAAARAEQLTAARRAATDKNLIPLARRDAQLAIIDVLAWLWDTVAEPVLTAVGAGARSALCAPCPSTRRATISTSTEPIHTARAARAPSWTGWSPPIPRRHAR